MLTSHITIVHFLPTYFNTEIKHIMKTYSTMEYSLWKNIDFGMEKIIIIDSIYQVLLCQAFFQISLFHIQDNPKR